MHYFGTDLDQTGHYFWDLIDDCMVYRGVRSSAPFNPELLVESHAPRGEVKYLFIEGYSICAIAGSCTDTRPGSKSVFWAKGTIPNDRLKEMILAQPIAKLIIAKLPFEVKW
jgi:hypothetical protein